MKVDVVKLLNWISFLTHCLALVMLLFAFCMPYWYISNESIDGLEIAGIWVRCHVGTSCTALGDTQEPMLMNMVPVQALMTISLVMSVTTFGLYALWLWKGEGCDTPWRKRCETCRESYYRSERPSEEAVIKYGRLKYLAFLLATVSGIFMLSGTVYFMAELMTIEGLTPGNIGWAAWLSLGAAVLLILQNGVISLYFYVLRRPDMGTAPPPSRPQEEDIYMTEEVDEKELERIRKWIADQKEGVENPSFESDYEVVTRPRPHRTKSSRSHSSMASGMFYPGNKSSSGSSLSGFTYKPPTAFSGNEIRRMMSDRPNRSAEYTPAYSLIFKNKVPMIPKPDFNPTSKYYHDVIYHGHKMAKPSYGVNEGRASSDLGINTLTDEVGGERHIARSASDTDLNKGRLSEDNPYETYTVLPSGKRIKVHYSQEYLDSLQPGVIPEAYRRRKGKDRRTTSSLPALTSSEPYRVRMRYPDIDSSGSSTSLPAKSELSHGNRGLDLAHTKEPFALDNIWVVPNRHHIQEAIGRSHVHFKLEQTIQELDQLSAVDETEESIINIPDQRDTIV